MSPRSPPPRWARPIRPAEHRFFAEIGVETVAHAYLGITDGFGLAEPNAEAILDLALGGRGHPVERCRFLPGPSKIRRCASPARIAASAVGSTPL